MRFYRIILLVPWLAAVGIANDQDQNVTPNAQENPGHNTKKKSRRLDCRAFLADGEMHDAPKTWRERLYRSLLAWRRRRRRWRRGHTPELAYQMVVMAAMSYWDFHKKPSIENPTNFTLSKRKLLTRGEGRIRRTLSETKASLATALQKASVSPPLVSREENSNRAGPLTFPPSGIGGINSFSSYGPTLEERLVFRYLLYDWHESGVGGVKFHDTDLLIASSETNRTLVIAFAGTSSAADAFTNVQTFEPAKHSNFYHGGKGQRGRWVRRHASRRNAQRSIRGSLHRGFLNAYSRLDRGSVVFLGNDTMDVPAVSYLDPLNKYFRNCTHSIPQEGRKNRESSKKHKSKLKAEGQEDAGIDNSKDDGEDGFPVTDEDGHVVRMRRKGVGCFSQGKKLSKILVEVATEALHRGMTVHVTGHSLGGAVASHFVLDLVINHPQLKINKLHLWTFGAPQIADVLFIASAVDVAPRLGHFAGIGRGGNGHLHRYVTLSDQCRVDMVSEVAKVTLPSHQERGIRGKIARRLGGVQDHIAHLAEPYYLLTPDQFERDSSPVHHNKNATIVDVVSNGTARDTTRGNNTVATEEANKTKKGSREITTTHSDIAAHACVNYILGISRESECHPLMTDFPENVQEFLMQ